MLKKMIAQAKAAICIRPAGNARSSSDMAGPYLQPRRCNAKLALRLSSHCREMSRKWHFRTRWAGGRGAIIGTQRIRAGGLEAMFGIVGIKLTRFVAAALAVVLLVVRIVLLAFYFGGLHADLRIATLPKGRWAKNSSPPSWRELAAHPGSISRP